MNNEKYLKKLEEIRSETFKLKENYGGEILKFSKKNLNCKECKRYVRLYFSILEICKDFDSSNIKTIDLISAIKSYINKTLKLLDEQRKTVIKKHNLKVSI